MKVLHIFFLTFIVTAIASGQNGNVRYASSDGLIFSAVVDTPRFSIPLTFDVHGVYSWGLDFGIYPGATKGIDPALGEVEYPPFPPGGGLAMFTTIGGNAILDLHPYTTAAQVDSYLVGFASDESAYPVTYSWPNLGPYYSGTVRLTGTVGSTSVNVDMKAQNSYTLATGPANQNTTVYLRIIAEGPQPGNSLPVVSTYGLANGGFQAIVHSTGGAQNHNSVFATAGPTLAWFEYGPTRSYGSSTSAQTVPDGSSMNISSPFSTGDLPLNTRVHFRAVAQNSTGTFYGGDRIGSNGNPAPEVEDTTHYRTATYRDWADAKDQKGKRKAIKCKPNSVAIKVNLVVPKRDSLLSRLELTFNVVGNFIRGLWADGKTQVLPLCYTDATPSDAATFKHWVIDLTCPGTHTPPSPGDTLQFDFDGLRAKLRKVAYRWTSAGSSIEVKGDFPNKVATPGDTLKQVFRVPMPNLHNVGEDIFGGVMQTIAQITIGMATPPHSVYLPRYKDVVKSLVKEQKGGDLYHTKAPHCLDTFDKNNKPINKRQKGLPPDNHNNRLFAEQLTLKLNIAASDSGDFPPGLGKLIFDNHIAKGAAGPFDGMTVRAIADSVDAYLGCRGIVAGTHDSTEFLQVDSLINAAFAGPMDTTSWSCDRVICKGVRTLASVPYLFPNPAVQPATRFTSTRLIRHDVPSEFSMAQNYPNPFNPTTTIEFELANDALVTVRIYNSLGQEVATLAEREEFDEGPNELEFSAGGGDGLLLSSGVYFYRILVEDLTGHGVLYSSVNKMILVK